MKIVFLQDDFPPKSFGGGGISTYELALGIKKAGQDVFVITTCRNRNESGESDYNGLRIIKIYSNYNPRWRWYVSLYNPPVVSIIKKTLSEIKPDIVHINNVHFYLSYHSIKVAKRFSRAVVVTLRDAMSFSFGKLQTKHYLETQDTHMTWLDNLKQAGIKWNPIRNLMIRHYLGYADRLLAVSGALKQALEENSISGVKVIHTGVNIVDWTCETPEGKPVILFSGLFGRAKGSDVVNKVMVKVKEAIPESKLYGSGEEGHWLARDEMKLAYAKSCLVLVPSVCFDAFPRVVIEAMAAGRPVVSTPYGGAKEAILDGETGYICNYFQIEEMARKVIELLENPEKVKVMGEAGRARIEKDFNLKDKIEMYLECYRELLTK